MRGLSYWVFPLELCCLPAAQTTTVRAMVTRIQIRTQIPILIQIRTQIHSDSDTGEDETPPDLPESCEAVIIQTPASEQDDYSSAEDGNAMYPDIAYNDPYNEGWLFIVEPDLPKKDTKKLVSGKAGIQWMEDESRKLLKLIGPEYEQLAATGAELLADIY